MSPHALPRRTAVAAHDRADEPPPVPAIVRLRGHELDFVVHRLPVGPVVQPKPCIVGVAEVCLVPYGGGGPSSLSTVMPLPVQPARASAAAAVNCDAPPPELSGGGPFLGRSDFFEGWRHEQ